MRAVSMTNGAILVAMSSLENLLLEQAAVIVATTSPAPLKTGAARLITDTKLASIQEAGSIVTVTIPIRQHPLYGAGKNIAHLPLNAKKKLAEIKRM